MSAHSRPHRPAARHGQRQAERADPPAPSRAQALFGKRPTEKDPAKGTSPTVDFTRWAGVGNGMPPHHRASSRPDRGRMPVRIGLGWWGLYRYCPGGVCLRCQPAPCLPLLRDGLVDGVRPCRARGPAFGACSCVLAVPAEVEAGAAAIGHHLVSRQADATHPAGCDCSPFGPGRGRTLLISHGLLTSESLGLPVGMPAVALARPSPK